MTEHTITVALAQVAPVWLQRDATIDKILGYVSQAADKHADLVVFGESLLPGYPWWLSITNDSTPTT